MKKVNIHFLNFVNLLALCVKQALQNGVADKKNQTLIEMINVMFFNAGLSKGFEGEAFLTMCHVQNRVPNKKIKTTPYELWKKRKFNLSYIRV